MEVDGILGQDLLVSCPFLQALQFHLCMKSMELEVMMGIWDGFLGFTGGSGLRR
jgi:hypothetical protein